MEERPRAQSAAQLRPTRTNKLLQGLSQFKGIIRISGRRNRDERELEHYPYSSRMGPMSNTGKPFMSQPHLALEGGSKMGQHDGEMSKLSGSSERFPSRDENTPPGKSSVNQEFPLRTSPRSSRIHKKSDPLPPRPSSPPQSMSIQSPRAPESTVHDGSGQNIDGLPRVMDPTPQVPSQLQVTPSLASNAQQLSKAQPTAKRPGALGGVRRPSTANSVQTTTSNTTVKAGPLLKLKRSFSQLRLNSFSKQHSDVTSPSPGYLPASPQITNISQTPATASPPLPSLSSPPVPPPKRPSTSHKPTSPIPPVTDTATIASPTPNMAISGALAPMSIHKPLPPLQRHPQDQPPKLSLAPVNHRISLTMTIPVTTDMGTARFSPTVISRPLPLPLLNLPTLTPRSDSLTGASGSTGASRNRVGVSGSESKGGRARASARDRERRAGNVHLKSMPALPLQGTGRGVKGREEMDVEDEDESADDDGEEEDDYDEESSRLGSSSRSDFLAPDMSADSMPSSFDSSASSLVSMRHEQHLVTASSSGGSRPREKERERTPSTGGSSYHSALSGFLPHPPNFPGINTVPILKHPTPPRGYTHTQAASTSATTTSGSASTSSSSAQVFKNQTQSVSHQGPSHYASLKQLPEVDTSKFDLSFLSSSPTLSAGTPQTVIDVKGKGKARDNYYNPSSNFASGFVTKSAQGAEAAYHHDPSKTPTTATVATGASFRGSGSGPHNLIPQIQTQKDKPNSPGSIPISGIQMKQSPTGTLRPQYGGPISGGVGGDYFSVKALGTGAGVGNASTTTSPQPFSTHSRTHNPPPQGSYPHHQPPPSSYHHPYSSRHSVAITPSSFGIQTPKASVAGMISPTNLLTGLPTPKRSSTLIDDAGGDSARSGGAVFTMPKMYKRASQSLIDLHTLETKERKRMLEEEMRAEEKMELAKMRERERAKEVGGKRKKEVEQKGNGRRSEDEKIKDDDDDEAGERKDRIGASPIAPNTINSSVTSTRLGDGEATNQATPSAPTATKKQNRLSTASYYLRRRRSMPMFDESSEPPPYPSFALLRPPLQYTVMPREDEGRERLPTYSNEIYLKAIMPRKMEFGEPGVQARDRKWRRVMVVLEGTVLRVYKCPPGRAGVGVLGEWWEKQVGAGDVSLQPSHSGVVSSIQIETRETRRLAEERRDLERQIQRIMKAEGGSGVVGAGDEGAFEGEDDDPEVVIVSPPSQDGSGYGLVQTTAAAAPQTPTSKSKFAQLLKPGRHHARSKSDAHMSERDTPSASPRPSLNMPRSGRSTPVSGYRSLSPFPGSVSTRAQTPMSNSSQSIAMDSASQSMTGHATPTSSAHSIFRRQQGSGPSSSLQYLYTNRERVFLPDPDPGDLVREYTLQNGESGIGNDYSKRKNVIRLRLEGEQFLLQARDVTGVVEWIEGLQAATNIALDLDERPMPRGPLFPRRRRRRRAQIGATGPSTTGEGGSAPVAIGTV